MNLASAIAALLLTACATPTFAPTNSAVERYEAAIGHCTRLKDMDMQSCLANLNTQALAEERQAFGANSSFSCEVEVRRFEGGTGYWSAAYICSIRERAKRIDARIPNVQ